MQRDLTHIHDYLKQTLPWYLHDRLKHHIRLMRETCELFSREILHTGRNSERPVHNCPENQILVTFLWRIGNQEQAGSNCDRSFCIQCSVDSPPSCSFGRGKIQGRNAKWNKKFPEFPNFRKKGQPRDVERNFRNEFPDSEPKFPESLVEWNAPWITLSIG